MLELKKGLLRSHVCGEVMTALIAAVWLVGPEMGSCLGRATQLMSWYLPGTKQNIDF